MQHITNLSLSLCALLILCLGQSNLYAEDAGGDKPEAEQAEKKQKKERVKLSNTGGTLSAVDKNKMTITITVPTEGDQAPVTVVLTCNDKTSIKKGKEAIALADLPLNSMVSAKYNAETKTAVYVRCKVKREKKPKADGDKPKREKKEKQADPDEGEMP